MVFDKIKDVLSGGGGDSDLGDMADKAGLDQYSKYLDGVSFPASKEDVMVGVQDNGAPASIMEHVKSLSGDRFNSAQEVFQNLLNR
ncbi:MAG: DUF2795 domain-containing protein [Thermomicrobiales bacterium]